MALSRLFSRKGSTERARPVVAKRTRSDSLVARVAVLSRLSGTSHDRDEARRGALRLSFCDEAAFVRKVVGSGSGDGKKKTKKFGQEVFKSLFGTEGVQLWKVVKSIITRYFGEARMTGLKNQIKTYCIRVAMQKAKGSFKDREWKVVYNAARALLSDLFYCCRLRDDSNVQREPTLRYFARVNPATVVESSSIAVAKASRFLAKNGLSRRGDATTVEELILPMLTPRFVYALLNSEDFATDRAALASALEPLLERRSYVEGWRCRRAGCFKRAAFGAVCVVCTSSEFCDRTRRPALRRFVNDASLTPHLRAFIVRTGGGVGGGGVGSSSDDSEHDPPLTDVLNFSISARRIRKTSSKSLQRTRARQLIDKHFSGASAGTALLRELVPPSVLAELEDQLLDELTPAALFVALDLCEARLSVLFEEAAAASEPSAAAARCFFNGSPEHVAFVAQEIRTTREKRGTTRRQLLEAVPRPRGEPLVVLKEGDDDARGISAQWVAGDRNPRFVLTRVLRAEALDIDVLLLPPRLHAILGDADAAAELTSALEEDLPGAGAAVDFLRLIAQRTAAAATTAFAEASGSDAWQHSLVVELLELLGVRGKGSSSSKKEASGGSSSSSKEPEGSLLGRAFAPMLAANACEGGDGGDALVPLLLGQLPAALHVALRHFIEGAWFGSDSYVCAVSSGVFALLDVCPDSAADFDDALRSRLEKSLAICRDADVVEGVGGGGQSSEFERCLAFALRAKDDGDDAMKTGK